MGDLFPFIFIAGIIALVGFGIIYSIYAEKKRRVQLQEVADEMGLTFFPDGDEALFDRLSIFNLFNQGHGRKMKNLIQGDSGEVKIAIFDYQYTTGSGKNSHTHKLSIACLQSGELNCPDFTMRPEGMFDKIGGALGFQDIDFESHPTFSNMFVLKSSNEDAIRNYFQPVLLEFFETKKGISLEAQPGMMFFARSGRRVHPTQLKDLLTDAYEVFGYMVDQE